MSTSGSFCPPMWLVCAARLKMTEAPSHRLRRSISRISPRTSSTGASARFAGFAPPPNRKPSSATTRAPRCANAWQRLEPRKPAPPVTSTFRPCQLMRFLRVAAVDDETPWRNSVGGAAQRSSRSGKSTGEGVSPRSVADRGLTAGASLDGFVSQRNWTANGTSKMPFRTSTRDRAAPAVHRWRCA